MGKVLRVSRMRLVGLSPAPRRAEILEPLPESRRYGHSRASSGEYPGTSSALAGAACYHLKGLPLMKDLACLNGETMPVEEARVPVWDRGFLFGDAVYEVFRMYRGRRWLESEHLARLRRSLTELDFGPYEFERLIERMDRTVAASEIREGTIYVQITRGVAPRSHAFPDPSVPPTELIVVRPYDDGPAARLRQQGARMISQPDLRWKRCDIKSTNLLANVLAYESARRAGCDEAVLVDSAGFVTEATHSSVLWVRQGRLEGTPEGHEILPGMTRQLVLRLAAIARNPVQQLAREIGRTGGSRGDYPGRDDL